MFIVKPASESVKSETLDTPKLICRDGCMCRKQERQYLQILLRITVLHSSIRSIEQVKILKVAPKVHNEDIYFHTSKNHPKVEGNLGNQHNSQTEITTNQKKKTNKTIGPIKLHNFPKFLFPINAPSHKWGKYSHHGLRARARPTLALLSMDLVSTSPEMVKNDLGRHSCWIRALALPELLICAFSMVNVSSACWVPIIMVFTLEEKLWVTSAPMAILVTRFTMW